MKSHKLIKQTTTGDAGNTYQISLNYNESTQWFELEVWFNGKQNWIGDFESDTQAKRAMNRREKLIVGGDL